MSGLEFWAQFGGRALGSLWAPVAAWTMLAGVATLTLGRLARVHPSTRYRLYQALLFALPLALVVATVGSVGQLPALADAGATVAPTTVAVPGALPAGGGGSEPAVAAVIGGGPDIALGVLGLLTGALALLSVVRLAVLGWQLRALTRLAGSCDECRAEPARAALRAAAGGRGTADRVRLLIAPPDTPPATFGWRRPVILVPAALVERRDDLRAAVTHELVHIHRGDFAWGVAEEVVRALFGVHPLVGVLRRRIERLREATCDLEVTATPGIDARAYAGLLADLATGTSSRRLAAGMAASRSQLRERLEVLRDFGAGCGCRTTRRLRSAFAGILLILVSTLGACFSVEETVTSPEDPSIHRPIREPDLTDERAFYDFARGLTREERDLRMDRLRIELRFLEYSILVLTHTRENGPGRFRDTDQARLDRLAAEESDRRLEWELLRIADLSTPLAR